MKKKTKKALIKYFLVLCFIFLAAGIGGSQVGWDNISENGIDAIFEEAQNAIQRMIFGEQNVSKNNQTADKIDGDFEIYVFDVGQADSILITCDNEILLIDAGNNEDGKLLADQLEAMGVTTINYLIGTHADEDHIGGMDDIIESFEIENFFMPSKERETATYKSVVSAAKEKKLKIVSPNIGDMFYIGDASCEVMSVINDNDADTNSTSIVIEVTFKNNKFLFMGDAEIENEEQRLWNDVDVLKVGHHGSSTSTSEDFLAQTLPEVAVISLGKDNSYGHPHRETVAVLAEYNVEVYRTDESGTIHITSDGNVYNVEALDIHVDR